MVEVAVVTAGGMKHRLSFSSSSGKTTISSIPFYRPDAFPAAEQTMVDLVCSISFLQGGSFVTGAPVLRPDRSLLAHALHQWT